jgi:hypothetical protein
MLHLFLAAYPSVGRDATADSFGPHQALKIVIRFFFVFFKFFRDQAIFYRLMLLGQEPMAPKRQTRTGIINNFLPWTS